MTFCEFLLTKRARTVARPNQSSEKRAQYLPLIAQCFAEQGYRRATTAQLAEACGVQETILYRLWPGKKQMFLAAIEFVFQRSAGIWQEVLEGARSEESKAQQILQYESRHLGELGLYRIIFAGLSETDDAEIRAALRQMFLHFEQQIEGWVKEHRDGRRRKGVVDASLAAWGLVGLGMVANLSRDLRLFGDQRRRTLLGEVGQLLLEGRRNG
jgi:AcrR family transcriptional regulator